MQGTAYAICTGYSRVRFLYENKNTQDAVEFAWDVTDEYRANVLHTWETLNSLTDNRTLAPMLKECLNERGEYRWCDFRKMCEGATFLRKVRLVK